VRERRAREARQGRLQHDGADPPALTDHGTRKVEPERRQVLAEPAGFQLVT
jgi:hypothetical protein